MPINGLPGAGALVTFADAYAAWFRRVVALGLGVASEAGSGTVAYYAQQARTRLMGDGTAANPGLGNAALQQALADDLKQLAVSSRYDVFAGGRCRGNISRLEQHISQNLPAGWTFAGSGTGVLDAALLRLNANSPGDPAAPQTPALAAATGGALPACSTAGAPRVVITYVGEADHQESPPGAEAAQVALAGAQGSYTFQLAGSVPVGVTKLRVYRGLVGGPAGAYFWDQDVALTAGSNHPAVTISQPDISLRQDVTPPGWLSCPVLPEFAALYALAFATLPQSPGAQAGPLLFSTGAMLSPSNVVLSRADGYLGYGNTVASGLLGQWAGGPGYAAGAAASTNDCATGRQGFAGATGLQARVTTALNAGATLTNVGYTYVDSTHATAQAGTVAGPVSLTPAVGSVASLAVPAGQLVRTVTALSVAGASAGAFVIEGVAPRAL